MKSNRQKFLNYFVICAVVLASQFGFFGTAASKPFTSDWSGSRIWIGPEFWANPLQDWRVEEGEVVGYAAHDRTLHLLTHQVKQSEGEFEMEVQVRLDVSFPKESSAVRSMGGFRFGIQGHLDDYRHVLVHAIEWIDAGIRGDGKLTIGKKISTKKLPQKKWLTLKLQVRIEGIKAVVTLQGSEVEGQDIVQLETSVLSSQLLGNIALLANGVASTPQRPDGAVWRFKDWKIKGSLLSENEQNCFGPILWTQYTLSRKTLKLTALMATVESSDEPVRLQLKRNGNWDDSAIASVDPLSRTAVFRVSNWNDKVDTPYRVAYRWQGEEYTWSGTVRRDPAENETVSIGAFSCDNGYIFPNTRITQNVSLQDPDLLFFAGDQIYEGFGGFGITRTPVDIAALDYLRKFWMFGWSWRGLLKDRPSVIIPDDHDVFQGNIWGHGGRRIPDLGDKPSGSDWSKGGYAMDPEWINAVERTQTSHLPDPFDPRPVEQGIGVYYTDFQYGGLSLAILEDRKFKSGPASVIDDLTLRRRSGNPKDLDSQDAELLGERQENFLKAWMQTNSQAEFKVVLSQTIFCKVTTHAGGKLNPSNFGQDANGWPQNKRNKALKILSGSNVIMVHGDQHLGALVHLGVDDWEDAPIAFMVPGTANGFPRAWWPKTRGENHKPGDPDWTGRYFDAMGNRMTVLAVANPEKGSNEIQKKSMNPEILGHKKGSGHGIIKFHPKTGEVTFEMWRLLFDAENPQLGDQFEGFPKTLMLKH